MNKLPLQLFIPTHKAELLYEYHRGCALCVGIKICVWGLLNCMCSYIKSASDITPKDKICWIGRQFPPCRCRFCQTNCVSWYRCGYYRCRYYRCGYYGYWSRYLQPPDPGAGAGGDEVVSQQVPGGRHQVVVPQPVDHHLQLPQLLLPGLNNKYFYLNLIISDATSCSLLSFSMVDILVASSWISLSAFLSSRKSSWLCSVCSSSLWIWEVMD